MMYEPFEEGIEVLGTSMISVIASLPSVPFIVDRYFIDVGLPIPAKLEPEAWYSQAKWLKIFKLISDKTGPNTLLNIGKKIPENAVFPLNISSIEEALQSIDIAFHMNHRNAKGQVLYDNGKLLEGIGHYNYIKKTNENKITMVCNNPYHCDFDRGIISAQAFKFKPNAIIMHDDSKECRKLGADSCTYNITW